MKNLKLFSIIGVIFAMFAGTLFAGTPSLKWFSQEFQETVSNEDLRELELDGAKAFELENGGILVYGIGDAPLEKGLKKAVPVARARALSALAKLLEGEEISQQTEVRQQSKSGEILEIFFEQSKSHSQAFLKQAKLCAAYTVGGESLCVIFGLRAHCPAEKMRMENLQEQFSVNPAGTEEKYYQQKLELQNWQEILAQHREIWLDGTCFATGGNGKIYVLALVHAAQRKVADMLVPKMMSTFVTGTKIFHDEILENYEMLSGEDLKIEQFFKERSRENIAAYVRSPYLIATFSDKLMGNNAFLYAIEIDLAN